jgi:hypothetical protein
MVSSELQSRQTVLAQGCIQRMAAFQKVCWRFCLLNLAVHVDHAPSLLARRGNFHVLLKWKLVVGNHVDKFAARS